MDQCLGWCPVFILEKPFLLHGAVLSLCSCFQLLWLLTAQVKVLCETTGVYTNGCKPIINQTWRLFEPNTPLILKQQIEGNILGSDIRTKK